jgi:hypothetical protein
MQIKIIVTLQAEGVHRWAECNIQEVAYLSNLHRHIFHIECSKKVQHANRDIEIINLKHEIASFIDEQFYQGGVRLYNFDGMSCEEIAILLLNEFNLDSVKVLEDGENGAEVTRD